MPAPIPTDASRTRKSSAYAKAKNRAAEYIKDSQKLGKLVNDAQQKAQQKAGPLKEVWASLMTSFRLIKAYANGSYRQIPWQSLLMIVTAVLYFVMPLDFVPDILVGLGLLDDAALLSWTIKTVAADLEHFARWEAEHHVQPENDSPVDPVDEHTRTDSAQG